jgi:predicted AAA+ superfamily ATPase
MQAFVKIKNGSYRNQEVRDEVFPLIKQFQLGSKGGYITVDGTGRFGKDKIRVSVATPTDYELVEAPATVQATNPADDEQRMSEIAERFDILNEMTKAVLNGDIRAMIVAGPPGVGKSYGIEGELERANLFDQISGRRVKSEMIKGTASALGMYKALYKYSDENSVIVFDDCDSILLDEICLNLLKGALDSGKKRRISWLADSYSLRNEGIPDQFDFKGGVIFITNLKFDQMKSQKTRDHLDAIQSRCHYLDLTLDTMHDKILRIKQIARTGELFSDFAFNQFDQDLIIEFMTDNQARLREVSLRMAIKIAQLKKSFPLKWVALAKTTCMKSSV